VFWLKTPDSVETIWIDRCFRVLLPFSCLVFQRIFSAMASRQLIHTALMATVLALIAASLHGCGAILATKACTEHSTALQANFTDLSDKPDVTLSTAGKAKMHTCATTFFGGLLKDCVAGFLEANATDNTSRRLSEDHAADFYEAAKEQIETQRETCITEAQAAGSAEDAEGADAEGEGEEDAAAGEEEAFDTRMGRIVGVGAGRGVFVGLVALAVVAGLVTGTALVLRARRARSLGDSSGLISDPEEAE